MKIGILGCGAMAETFAETLRQMEGVECWAAASRTLERADRKSTRLNSSHLA